MLTQKVNLKKEIRKKTPNMNFIKILHFQEIFTCTSHPHITETKTSLTGHFTAPLHFLDSKAKAFL
jgi:hypothetical protein